MTQEFISEELFRPMRTTKDGGFARLMIAHDVGSAIKGPERGDIFFGEGSEAEYLAGYMKGRGLYSLLVPKEIASQLP